jgi:hypothetical protein
MARDTMVTSLLVGRGSEQCWQTSHVACPSTILAFGVRLESESCAMRLITFGEDRLSEMKGDAIAR